MGRKCIQVETLHGLTIKDLQNKVKQATSSYTRNVLTAVIMRYSGISTNEIMKVLGVSRPTVTKYINEWNANPAKSIVDHRGGNIPSKLTDEMVEDIRYVLIHKKPSDFGYFQSNWNCSLLSRYIEDTYGTKFCHQWLAKLLKRLGFSYKRGMYKPTKADPELQEKFKKNVYLFGYN
ncbi:helix-turn-helix domain-containing protein [Thermotalea metallivorans]|uniref:Winged helix-turn helix domain-containing protein n=1 Tax=Thermotalea metallivorans TaxID=520762 RepID=A0A140KZ76_9FIRM|nr:winged helix-turn-helix domain-containing protein [Thermotalea metallivorans]KXG73601.1 hypothetical protein AN619_30690 [Thermotalea metallivorans]